MFDPSDKPRVFGVPPGADFPQALVDGLRALTHGRPPEDFARAEIFVNTHRMQRRIREIFESGPAMLLPRIRLVTDLGQDAALAGLPPATPPLRRRLELTQFVAELLHQQPDLAPRTALFDLADSLAALMDEMQGEGVSPDDIDALDVTDQSGHWERAKTFFQIVQRYFSDASKDAPDVEARQRMVVERLVENWAETPPQHPIIIAGSTGSRGTTHLLMEAAAKLPQGALVLPGFDFDQPASVWHSLQDALLSEDHPQYRFYKLLCTLNISPQDVVSLGADRVPSPARNALVSLALRPAPVTDQWMREGRNLRDLDAATDGLAMIEAPSGRVEALTIALKLRDCAETGKTAALITPDRVLTRQVTAALDRWGIEPDDSAGLPLPLSAPGRLLLHVAALFGQKLTSEHLLALLKHPLLCTGEGQRGPHLLWTHELELSLRRFGPPFPTNKDLALWASKTDRGDGRVTWAAWLGDLLTGLEDISERNLSAHVDHLLELTIQLAAGPDDPTSGTLWDKPAGRAAKSAMEELSREAPHGGALSPNDFSALLRAVLNRKEVRDPTRPHPNIMIWGTLEARVQGADVVILAGLNEGIWPEQPSPDPWLNRALRDKAGLLLPERRIGLSAHDFQQAVAAPEVWLSRAVRDAEAETVPSRWINRLVNLLNGLHDTGGEAALVKMTARGTELLQIAAAMEEVKTETNPAQRPSPRPPLAARPKRLSVTQIKRLIRDPYWVYARHVLRLQQLDPLKQQPDAPLRGTILHSIFERFIKEQVEETRAEAKARLLALTDEVLEAEAPWPAARSIWRAKLARVADWFLESEDQRQRLATPHLFEEPGKTTIAKHDFTLTAKSDRFDLSDAGEVLIYDYKTGSIPGPNEQKYFDKQLPLTAAMVERGAFEKLGPTKVVGASYIGLGASPKQSDAPLADEPLADVWAEFESLIAAYFDPAQGFTSRRAMWKTAHPGEFDHLARYGEWDDTDDAHPEDLT